MATISSGLTRAIVGLSDLFSKRAWPLAEVLLAGAILAVGPRTISAVLRVMGLAHERQFQKYHRVLNRVSSKPSSNIGGSPPALKPEHIAVLHDIVTERVQVSLQEIADELHHRCGLRVCAATIRRALRAQGWH